MIFTSQDENAVEKSKLTQNLQEKEIIEKSEFRHHICFLFIYLFIDMFLHQSKYVSFRNQSVVILKDWIENYIRKKNQYRMRFSIKFIQYVREMKFSKKQDF